MKRIIIIEDHPIVLLSLKSGLHGQGDIQVIDTFTSGKRAVESPILPQVDLALLDINLPEMDGFEVCAFLHKNYPSIKIIGISSFQDAEYINRFIQMGAHGYMVKGTRNAEMIVAIDEVLAGNMYFCEIAKNAINNKETGAEDAIRLTQREKKLVSLIQLNKNISQIASEIGENEKTTLLFLELLESKLKFYNMDLNLNFSSYIGT